MEALCCLGWLRILERCGHRLRDCVQVQQRFRLRRVQVPGAGLMLLDRHCSDAVAFC